MCDDPGAGAGVAPSRSEMEAKVGGVWGAKWEMGARAGPCGSEASDFTQCDEKALENCMQRSNMAV